MMTKQSDGNLHRNHMSTEIKYRPEIDGLRTIAVMSVVFYHARFLIDEKNIIPGGFLGVDVFFVISGFLISSIILRGVKDKSFSFVYFYERRARRILPILLFVMLVSLPLAWKFFLPTDLIDFSYQILTSIFFSSNFYFWLEDPYWATESSLKPFLHTWSLGVEEQFYLLMPILLMGLYRYQRNYTFHFIFGLGIVSLALAQWMSGVHPEQAFFLLPTRAWELFAGACLGISETRRNFSRYSFTTYFPTLGVILIVASFFLFNENTRHPSLLTLIPVLGTMLVICFSNSRDLTVSLLKTRWFVALGLISYGIYIWHFPVFAFHKIIFNEASANDKILLIFAVILISSLSYFLVEKPFRRASITPLKVFIPAVSLFVVSISSFAYLGSLDGFKERVPALVNQPSEPERIRNHVWFRTGVEKRGSIILVGDSHTNAIASTLKSRALARGYDFVNSSFDGCQLIVGADRVRKSDLKPKYCNRKFQEKRMGFIVNSKNSFVIIGGRLPLILEEDRFNNHEGGYEGPMTDFIQNADRTLTTLGERQEFIKRQYRETVQRILDAGHKVVLIYPIPEVGWHVPKRLHRLIGEDLLHAREIVADNPVTTDYKVFMSRTNSAYGVLDSISNENVIRVYPEKLFCNTEIRGRCVTHDLENSFYLDDDHLSQYGAKLLVEYLLSRLTH